MGTVDATARELLDGAHGTLTGLLDIIADWLQLSRINAGDITGAMSEIEIQPVIDKVVQGHLPARRGEGRHAARGLRSCRLPR